MAWNTSHLRAEIVSEFSSLNVSETRIGGHLTGFTFRHVHRRVWSRQSICCRTCGVVFVPLNTRRLYCSAGCHNRYPAPSRLAWHAAVSTRRLLARSDRVCADPRCCKVFTGTRSDSKYCSHRCLNNWKATRYQRRKRGVPELVVRLPGRWGNR